MVIKRQPLRSHIVLAKGWNSNFLYTWMSQRLDGGESPYFAAKIVGVNDTRLITDEVDINPMAMVLTSGTSPHDAELAPAQGGVPVRRGFWLDGGGSGTTLTVYFLNAGNVPVASTTGGNLKIWEWRGGVWQLFQTVGYNAGAMQVQYVVFGGGYYAISMVRGLTDVGGGVAVTSIKTETNVFVYAVSTQFVATAVTGTDIWSHHAIPGLFANRDSIMGCRVLAVSAWQMNEAAPLVQQGTLVQLQLPASTQWNQLLSASAGAGTQYTEITSYEGAEWRQLAKGGYSYHKVSSTDDLRMQTCFTFGDQGEASSFDQATDQFYELNDPCDSLVFYSTATAAGSGDSNFEMTWALEFRTNNSFFMELTPTISAEAWKMALEGTATAQQHFDNGIHWSAIFKTVGKIANIASPILSMFGPYGKAIGSVAGAVGSGVDAYYAGEEEGERKSKRRRVARR
jgi:hypothetical protein